MLCNVGIMENMPREKINEYWFGMLNRCRKMTLIEFGEETVIDKRKTGQ